ncbi:MAG: hypothetical protein WBV55_22720 [Candidatus Sulfotelmatobacter sp.]
MVRHIAALEIVSLLFLAVCVMAAQSPDQALPDDPSVGIQGQKGKAFEDAWRLAVGARSNYTPNSRQVEHVEFEAYQKHLSGQKDPNTLFTKYLKPPSSSYQKPAYPPAGAENLMDRAVHAASRTFIIRDESGKGRINTSYFLRTLTAVVADTASRPYWRRSVGEPFSDFGSNVGNRAGMNVLHEFEPSLQQALKSHTPRFVSRIEERVSH